MPEDLRVWVAERKPITGSNAGELADNYLQARQQATRMGGDGEKTGPRKQCHQCGSTGHLVWNCPQKSITKDADEQKEQNGQEEHPDGYKKNSKSICFNCKKCGHILYNCPDKAGFCGLNGRGESMTRCGCVQGVEVTDILLDTGCTQTMVRGDLVSQDQLIEGEAATIRCVYGDNVLYSLADVTINLEGFNLTVRAAVSKTFPMSVLLGTDVPQLGALVHGNPARIHSQGVEHALITTRAQARKQEEEEEKLKKRTTAVTKPLEGEQRDVEEGAIEKSGEWQRTETVRKMGEQITEVEV